LPPPPRPWFANRSPPATRSLYLLQGEDEIEKSGLAGEFADVVEEGLRAFNVERIHAGEMTTGDKLADGVASARGRGAHPADDGARRVVIVMQAETLLVPKRESEAAARALEELETLLERPEPQATLVFVPRRSTSASACGSCSEARDHVECGVIEESRGGPAVDSRPRRERRRRIEPGRRAAAWRAGGLSAAGARQGTQRRRRPPAR